jgi:hypothetical protein
LPLTDSMIGASSGCTTVLSLHAPAAVTASVSAAIVYFFMEE